MSARARSHRFSPTGCTPAASRTARFPGVAVSDFLFEKDKIFAYINLERNADLQELLRRLRESVRGTQYFLPLGPN